MSVPVLYVALGGILRCIKNLKPYKASKSGSVPNSIFTHAGEILIPHLGPLFRATHTLDFYPREWATTETLVLKKPGKTDYTVPLAWQPIVLSDGMAWLLNSCHTSDMVSMCEIHKILPPNHYGARPGRTTMDSIHMLTKTVKDAWRKGQVTSSLFLDIKSPFPSVESTLPSPTYSARIRAESEWIPGGMVGMVGIW